MESFTIKRGAQRAKIHLKVSEQVVDSIEIDVAKWSGKTDDELLEIAYRAVSSALFEEVSLNEDVGTPLLF